MNTNIFPAHIKRAPDGKWIIQSLSEHSRSAGSYALEALSGTGLEKSAYLAGLIHDLGKCKLEFADYLWSAARGEILKRGKVNHTFAAVRYLLSTYHGDVPLRFEDFTSELLAYAAGAHHGLFDCVSEFGDNGFLHRINQDGTNYEEAVQNFLCECATAEELDALFHAATAEMEPVLLRLKTIATSDAEMSFYGGMLARLLLSSVIEGDRRDTADFMLELRRPEDPEPVLLWKQELSLVEQKLAGLPFETPIQRTRRAFSEACAALGEKAPGIYRLSLPTGGGKTLAALRGALSHAYRQKKKRIIFVTPLLAVLDQNAAILREYLQNDSIILEHHSNLISDQSDDELDTRELLLESWRSPVIITTLVQLLNTLFDGRTSCVRRMQSLCDSVLVIDEVHSVPPRFLSLFHLSLNFLASICKTTVLLCSATLPATEHCAHPLAVAPEELVPYDPILWEPFRRIRLLPPTDSRLSEIGALIREHLRDNYLLVCNTRAEAADIYRQLSGVKRFHLSASMCMAHRRKVLADIEQGIRDKQRFVCVSTQVMECGVNISFCHAGRFLAGFDSILQTAGRCNRNGESPDPVEVTVFRCTDERLAFLPEINHGKAASEALFQAYVDTPEIFDYDLTSQSAISFYYKKLYQEMENGAQDGPLGCNAPTLYQLLSDNRDFASLCLGNSRYWMCQAFHFAGTHFKVFDNNTVDIVVPYREGAEIIRNIQSERASRDLRFLSSQLEQAKPYSISVFQWQKESLVRQGALHQRNGIWLLDEGWYDDALGVLTERTPLELMEV